MCSWARGVGGVHPMHPMVQRDQGRYNGPTMRFPNPLNKQKNGAAMAYPDVCKVPAPPAPFVPAPFPNVAAASNQFKGAAKKVKSMQKEVMKKSSKGRSGDEAGTLKGIVSSINKMSVLFDQHSVKVKTEGKKASMLASPDRAKKAYTNAVKLQKTFEKKLEAECKKLTNACKADREQMKIAQRVIALVTRGARGHRI